ncbi:MAG TPA: SRPBCC family protein [Phenylobacterium sp.]|uniref:SRPBCC family protein n=1 Tax=Phenylobacterium sp. TaxID=1871053 RepID=UPI002B4931D8|nr:SRPBCC family protein [Phenylobacterium sp.]HKR88440.1 SRPBCC family protein [Phenylobacterium sp.]
MAVPVDIKPENDRELVIGRRIAAPAAALFRCWTDPALIPQWFCPKPWVAEVVKMDVRPGGSSQMIFKGPDGQSFPNDGVYLEVVPNQKLVFTDAYTEGWRTSEKPMFTGVITFEEAGNGETLYVARARHWTDAATKQHQEMGFHEGWGVCAEQMEALAKTL